MGDEAGSWASLAKWVLSNPEKGALFLVVIAGAWRWIRELRGEAKSEGTKESFMDLLLAENRELRREIREMQRKSQRAAKSKEDKSSGRSDDN